MPTVEESHPLHAAPRQTGGHAPPRRPSPLSPFANADRPKHPIARGISEESRTLGNTSPTQSSTPSEASSSSSGAARPRQNSSTQALLLPRPVSGIVPRAPSMILYHLALTSHPSDLTSELPPPRFPTSASSKHSSMYSRDSVISMSSDSKYPAVDNVEHGYVPYAYDPLLDDDDDELVVGKDNSMSWRGVINMGTLIFIIVCILVLFVAGPVLDFARRDDDLYKQHGGTVGAKVQANRGDPATTTTAEDTPAAAVPTPDAVIPVPNAPDPAVPTPDPLDPAAPLPNAQT